MIQKITKKLLLASFALLLLCVNLFTFGAGKMKDIELDPGKGENVGNQIKVFPTIAQDLVTVHFFFETDGIVSLQVYDLQGRVVDGVQGYVSKARTHETTVDASALANGTYFVKLTSADGATLTSKVIVRH
ncbi:MAG TPA: T9SS type A sorting domain-containing protein [Bacteroidia bacterium]|nr:T9SS type A sorting domain-containing protein [Bacteroidia bacterium]